jgi:hypothetical protein
MAISKKSWLGIGLETVPGTALATPSKFIPTKSIVKGTQHKQRMNDERGDRNANYDVVATTREGDGDPKGDYYNDTSPYFLFGFMGADTVTQPDATHVPTVYRHTLGWADTLPTFTLFKSYDGELYTMPFSVVEKVTLKYSTKDKLLEIDSTIKGLFPVHYTGAPITPTFSTVKPFPGYLPVLTITAGATTDISELTLEMEQKLDLFYGGGGSQDFIKIDPGERKASLSFTARFDSETPIYSRWRTAQDDTLHIVFTGPLIANSGASGTPPNTDYNQSLDINIPVFDYDEATPDLSQDAVMLKAKGTIRPVSGSLFSVVVQNTVAQYN